MSTLTANKDGLPWITTNIRPAPVAPEKSQVEMERNPFIQRIIDFPGYQKGFWTSPKRLRNMAGRLSETLLALLVFWLIGPTWYAIIAALLAEFVLYEFVLEPAGLVGHYFERGPRDGETFKVG